jgi:hypothetical protein
MRLKPIDPMLNGSKLQRKFDPKTLKSTKNERLLRNIDSTN